jgi:aminodeoxyfutalosine synthase
MDGPLPDDLLRRVRAGDRLDRDDALFLYGRAGLEGLRALANEVAERRHGRRVTYAVNRHLNYSNVCVNSCFFCAFSKKRGEPGAYEFDLAAIRARAREAAEAGATELHIVGGIHPDWPYETYPRMLRTLSAEFPALALKAFTAVELDWFARLAERPVEWVIEDLKEAGLAFVPGGGAEVLSDRVWKKLYRTKIPPARWLEVHRAVHRAGLRSNATMLFGHIETTEEKADHLIAVRALQDETGGFVAFIPLRFHPENTVLAHLPIAPDEAFLREIAVARLVLDNVPHVKAYWIMAGLDAARRALTGGADDFDGTVVEERITHMAGALTPEGLPESRIREIIVGEGKSPVRR